VRSGVLAFFSGHHFGADRAIGTSTQIHLFLMVPLYDDYGKNPG
jgi:hypothetical protein